MNTLPEGSYSLAERRDGVELPADDPAGLIRRLTMFEPREGERIGVTEVGVQGGVEVVPESARDFDVLIAFAPVPLCGIAPTVLIEKSRTPVLLLEQPTLPADADCDAAFDVGYLGIDWRDGTVVNLVDGDVAYKWSD